MDYSFTHTLTGLFEHSLVSAERPLRCIVIVNSAAGGFMIKSRFQDNKKILKDYRQKAQVNPKRQIYKNVILELTDGKGCAGRITREIIGRAEKDPIPFYLIVCAGGDGTHGEVMFALCNASAEVRSNMAVLKLPMGTGNDGAGSANLEEALDKLIHPTFIDFAPAVKLTTAPSGPSSSNGPFFAFNILSVGLDAFVTHMTNKMKGKTPGDSYKFWIDIACLFYECKYKVDLFDVKAFDNKNNEVISFKEKLLLLAMGASGHRTYGSGQKVLPDDRNVCAMKKMSLFRKLAVKKQVKYGSHINNPEAIIFDAHRLEFSGKHPILAQMDGEAVLLQPDDFPAVMELTAPLIPLLKRL